MRSCSLCETFEINERLTIAQIEVTLKDSTEEGEEIKKFLHTKGKDTIREKLKRYVSSLKEGR